MVIDDSDRFIYVSSEKGPARCRQRDSHQVNADGTLTELFPPTALPINEVTRAQGCSVSTAASATELSCRST
jgi:hypothetical protein